MIIAHNQKDEINEKNRKPVMRHRCTGATHRAENAFWQLCLYFTSQKQKVDPDVYDVKDNVNNLKLLLQRSFGKRQDIQVVLQSLK